MATLTHATLAPSKTQPLREALWDAPARRLLLAAKKTTVVYAVAEVAVPAPARLLRLTKVTEGGDVEGDAYDVVAERGRVTCDCKGHVFGGRCKHADAVRELIRRGEM